MTKVPTTAPRSIDVDQRAAKMTELLDQFQALVPISPFPIRPAGAASPSARGSAKSWSSR
jgi:hypothetical protein